ncbi:MAG: carbohydrate porin [Planctomycetota bacterium]|jgi:carbohydrate-selective porin OprB
MKKCLFRNVSWVLLVCVLFISLTGTSLWAAENDESIWEDNMFTNGFQNFNDWLDQYGIEAELESTPVYQQNVRGGKRTSDHTSRLSWSYELGLTFDMDKIASIEGGEFWLAVQGGQNNGITDPSVGSHFPVLSSTYDYSRVISEAYWNQYLFDRMLYLRLGKLDMKGKIKLHGRRVAFDGNVYAGEKKRQFFNKALYYNRSIPFPDNGLGAIALLNPRPGFYVAGGLSDAQANEYETGFRTAFHKEPYFLYMGEVGFMPDLLINENWLPGTYRFGAWYAHDKKTRYEDGSAKYDDAAFYLSFDQMLLKENDVKDDKQGMGGFFRYSFADEEVNPVSTFWSCGVQYQGLFEGRDDDVLGFGFTQGIFTDKTEAGFTDNSESIYELYYEIKTTSWLNITLDAQYITDTGGTGVYNDAFVLGARFFIHF